MIKTDIGRPAAVFSFEHTGLDQVAISTGVKVGVIIGAAAVELVAIVLRVVVKVVLAHEVFGANRSEFCVEILIVVRDAGIPAKRAFIVAGQTQFLLKVLTRLFELEVIDVQRRTVVVLGVVVVVIFIACIGGEGGKA